jgi:hypothetical protein
MQMSTSLVASSMPVEPQAWKNALLPPKVPVPRVSAGTLNPDLPSCLYSMMMIPVVRKKALRSVRPSYKVRISSNNSKTRRCVNQ